MNDKLVYQEYAGVLVYKYILPHLTTQSPQAVPDYAIYITIRVYDAICNTIRVSTAIYSIIRV